MIQAKTYTVGRDGSVLRLDDLTGSWIDVSIAGAPEFVLFDVETDPNDGDKVFAVGEGFFPGTFFGIGVSFNGGVSWIVPGGDYQTASNISGKLKWYEVHVLDSLNIMVCGDQGYVAISNDGGLTFNLTTQIPLLPNCDLCTPSLQSIYSLHFVTPLVGVIATETHVLKTIDGGLTWNILNAGNILNGAPNGDMSFGLGIHLSVDQSNIVVLETKGVYHSVDGGLTFNKVYVFSARNGLHLTWINENELWGFANQGERIKSIDSGATWTVIQAYTLGGPIQKAGHFYLNQNGFYSNDQTVLVTVNGSTTGLISNITIGYSINAVWTWYLETQCYLLESCDSSTPPIYVSNDFSQNIGQIIQICPEQYPALEECTCYTIVGEVERCEGEYVLPDVLVFYENCNECLLTCFLLIDCLNVNNYIITSDNFTDYLGKTVKLSDCPDTCWQVFNADTCDNSVCVSEVIESFDSCVECLPQPEPEPPLELHTRRIKPGYYTKGCSPAYTEKVNCTFGEQMYNEMIAKRYGLTVCCQEDADKWSIKKELLDLKAIYDPELCKSQFQSCCPPTCVSVILQVFNPITCPQPILEEAFITIETPICPEPGEINFVSIIIDNPPLCPFPGDINFVEINLMT